MSALDLLRRFDTTWLCPVCASLAGEAVESCEGYVDIADPEEGETEDTDARHDSVYRPEYVERLQALIAANERRIAQLEAEEQRLDWLFLHCEIRTRVLRDDAEFRDIRGRKPIDKALAEERRVMRGAA